jgi:cob(I)alamin adenosyltransferase
MKVYTKTGDTGTTSLLEGLVPKDHIRIVMGP